MFQIVLLCATGGMSILDLLFPHDSPEEHVFAQRGFSVMFHVIINLVSDVSPRIPSHEIMWSWKI